MNRPRKWERLTKSLIYSSFPFRFIKNVTISTSSQEYKGYSQEDFHRIMSTIKEEHPEEDIVRINFESNHRLLKKEVQEYIEPLFQKYFLKNSID